jgi:hypothetical protein
MAMVRAVPMWSHKTPDTDEVQATRERNTAQKPATGTRMPPRTHSRCEK